MKKVNFKKWLTFSILVLGAGTFTKAAYLKDAFYIPMQEYMNVTHTQIGLAMSVYGLVQAFGNSLSIYISDRFSKKILVPFGLIGVSITGFYLATFPNYIGILISWGLFSLFAEVISWPVILKSIRLLGRDNEQGRLFSFLELGRGIVDVSVAFIGLRIFILLGSNALALRSTIIFFSITVMIAGILSYFLLENDTIKLEDEYGNKISKDRAVLNGIIKVLKNKEIWLVSLTIFSVYSVYCGITYFIPFLKDIYGVPLEFLGFYGIINQYGLKIIGSPTGGICSDKIFKSPTRYIRLAFILSTITIIAFILLPHEHMNKYFYVGMILTLSYGIIIFSMRAIYFAPINEIKVAKEITGTAMSVACMIGYFPRSFIYTLYGYILDNNNGIKGYNIIFSIMACFSILGILISSILLKNIKNKVK